MGVGDIDERAQRRASGVGEVVSGSGRRVATGDSETALDPVGARKPAQHDVALM